MSLKHNFSVALLAAVSMVVSMVGASATQVADPKSVAGAIKTTTAEGFELIEYVSPTAASERAGSPSNGSAASSPSGAPGGPSEVEPNNTFGTANPLGGSNVQVTGNISPGGDFDFYSFDAVAGDRIYASTQTTWDASGSGDTTLQLIASDGSTIIETDNNDGTFNASSASLAGTLIPSPGTYYVRVAHNTGTGTIRPYTLHFRQQSVAPVAEVEPNNTTATATPLPASGHVSGSVSAVSPGEADFFSLALNAGDTVFLSLDMNPERDAAVWNGRLGFGLFGNPPANQILIANDGNAGAVATDPNSEAFFFTVKDAGTYFVYVDSTVATGLGANATYNLSASVRPRVTPPGVCTTYNSTDVPQAIAAGAPPITVSSTITVPGNPRIADLDVAINLDHTFMQDLDAQLISPAGNDVGLFTDIGAATVGGLQTLMDVIIDDEAGLPPAFTMSAPFHIQPELSYRLSWFDGSDAGGTWTLQLRDDANGDGGMLNSWSITICEPPPAPVCPAGFAQTTVYSTDFEAGAAGFTSSGVQNEWALGLPATAGTTTGSPVAAFNTCNSGTSCWKTDLTGTYNASSSQDLLSPAIDLTGLSAPVVVRWAQRYQMESATFDHMFVDHQQVGGATPVRLFEHLDATMTNTGGATPLVNIPASSGWAVRTARADALAGLNTEVRFHLDSDSSINFGGMAVDDVTVTACRPLSADAAITKTNGVANSVPGTNTVYTIVASNAGPDPITAGTVTDNFPVGTTCNWTCTGAMGGTCPASGMGNINAAIGLPMGGTATFTATCAISAAATGSLANTASIVAGISDPNMANDSATDTDTLTPQANLGITKSNGVTGVGAGQMTTYTIVASNTGPSDAPGSVVTDNFTADFSACSTTCVGAGGGTCPAGPVAGNINSVANLPAGGSATYTATCTVSGMAVGSVTNTATVATGAGVTDPTPGNNSATDTDPVGLLADVAITSNVDDPDPVIAGNNLSYAITAQNNGPSSATNLAITLPMPATTTFVSVSAPGSAGCATPAVGGNGNIVCTWATTNPGAANARTLTAFVGVPAATASGTTLTTMPSVAAVEPDSVPANNLASNSTAVVASANLGITKTDNVAAVTAGQPTTYTIVASNAGPSNAPGSVITDTFGAELSNCSTTCVGAGGATCPAGPVAGNINSVASIPVGGTATYSATCTVLGSAVGPIINTANVAAGAPVTDPTPGNNSATDTNSVTLSADLQFTTSSVTPDPVNAGENLTYSLIVFNNGPSVASNHTISLPMPAGTGFVSVSAPGSASCSTPAPGANGTISCTWATTSQVIINARNLVALISVPANATIGSTLSATATTSADEMDPNTANNSLLLSATVGGSADLAISKTDNALTAQVNSAGTYVITASNAGPSNAVGATVTDSFPANFTAGAWTCVGAGGGTCPANGSGNIAATVDIPANGSVTFSVAGTYGGAIGTVTNTATVAAPANAPDGNPANNSATDTTDIVSPATLSATKSVGGNFVVGGGVVYSIAITNSGPQAQLDNPGPEFVDVLPFGFAYISATATSGTLSYVPATRTLSWSGAVAVNQIIGITINGSIDPAAMGTTLSNQGAVQFDADGNGTNEATALSDDPGVVGTNDPTVITVGLIQAVPANNLLALLLLALAVGLTGMWLVRRV